MRHRNPAATLLIAAAAIATYFALGYSWGPAFLPLIVAMFAAILAGYRLLAWLTCGIAYLVIVWSGYVLPNAQKPDGVVSGLTTAAWPLVILVGAEVVRAGRSARRAPRAAAPSSTGGARARNGCASRRSCMTCLPTTSP